MGELGAEGAGVAGQDGGGADRIEGLVVGGEGEFGAAVGAAEADAAAAGGAGVRPGAVPPSALRQPPRLPINPARRRIPNRAGPGVTRVRTGYQPQAAGG